MDRVKKRRRNARRKIRNFALLSVALALILLLVNFAVFFVILDFHDLSAPFADKYFIRYYTSDNRNTSQKSFSYAPDFILRDGNLYLDFSALADLCGFAVTGDADQRRYLPENGEGDYLTVNIGTTSVVVSGQPISLCAPSFLSAAGSLYLPCEFVDDYIDGISIEPDEKNKRLIRVFYDAEEGCTLILHQTEPCSEVAPPDEPG